MLKWWTPFIITLIGVFLNAQPLELPLTRTFHDQQNRPLKGELLQVKEDQVYLRRDADGKRFWVLRDQLSEADQSWLEEHFDHGADQMPHEAEPLDWPDRAEPEESVQIEIVEEVFKEKRFIYASQHFQYESPGRLTRTLVRDFAEVFEATYAAVMQMPLPFGKLPPEEPMRVRIFDTMDEYIAAGGFPNSAGVYIYSQHSCLVPVSSLGLTRTSTGYRKEGEADYWILLHEVTHQVMHKWRLPVWIVEGIAEYMERVPYKDGTIHFRRYDVKRAVQDMKSNILSIQLLNPNELLAMSHRDWNASFETGDRLALSRNYMSAFILTAFYLNLSDDESAVILKKFLEDVLAGKSDADRQLYEHSSGIDLETRFLRALRSLGIQAEYADG